MTNRLERMIARLTTQRACLQFAVREIAPIPGPVLEVGLGKGRTFDFLRTIAPDRVIYGFDKEIHAPADCVPEAGHLFVGDFRDTFVAAQARMGGGAVLAHADFGSEDQVADGVLGAWIGEHLPLLMAPGGLILSDRAVSPTGSVSLPLPEGVSDWPYYIYRLAGA